jgi:hypothetical protein
VTRVRGAVWLGLAAAACLAGYIYAYSSGRAGTPIRSDAFSYFVYLPSWILYRDPSLQAVADDCCGGEFPDFTAIVRWRGTRRWVDAHPIGEAILIAPFFAVAHALTRWTNLSPDGFSLYYQHAAGIAGLFYVLAGLWCLGRLLRRYFSEGVVLATLAAMLAGTSLYHYATFDSTWSHAFAFVLVAAFLERLDARRPERLADDLTIGAISGLLILVRHTHALIPLCFLGADMIRTRRIPIVPALVATLVVAPQLWLYYRATNHLFISPYDSLGFTFATPHIFGVLASTQKGLFVYAPLLLAAIAGAINLPKRLQPWRAPAAILLIAETYLIASWWDWQFGASYGHRGFVDFYPLFAIGLASAFTWAAASAPRRAAVTIAVVALCALSIFQMLQYWHGVLPMSDTTPAQYRAVFLRGWW